MRMNTVWVGRPQEGQFDDLQAAHEQVLQIGREFVRQYCLQESQADMLRAHYGHAPLQFQRSFLDWILLADGILGGYNLDVPDLTNARFDQMVRDYPTDFPANLWSSLNRLTLYLRPRLEVRRPSDYSPLLKARAATWDFWSTFGLFLSVRYNWGIAPDTIARYSQRASTELPAYLRRLNVLLEQGYLSEGLETLSLRAGPSTLSSFVASEVQSELDRTEG